MARAESVLDLLVVARTRVGVLDEDADGRARGLAFEHTGQDAHDVAFLALADELRGAGAAAIHVALQVGFSERQAGRTAIDYAAQRRAMAFAESGDGEQATD